MQHHDADLPFDGRPLNDPTAGLGAPSAGAGKMPNILNSNPTPANLFRCLQRRLVFGVGLGVVLAGLAATATWFFAPQPKHQVRTLISVPPHTAQIVQLREHVPDQGSHQRNQVAMAKSRLVLNSALREPKVTNLPAVVNQIDPVEWLEGQVYVDFSVAPDIMKISMRGMETDELVILVDAVRAAYVREIEGQQQNSRASRQTVLEELIRKYTNELKGAREAQRDDEDKIGGKNMDARARKYAFFAQSLAKSEGELISTRSRMGAAKVKIAGLEAREKNLATETIPDIEVDDILHQATQVKAIKVEIARLEERISSTLTRAAKGENDPSVKDDRRTIQNLKAKIEKIRKEKGPELLTEVRDHRRKHLSAELIAEKNNLASLATSESYLEADVKRVNDVLAAFGKAEGKVDNFTAEISHLETLLSQLKKEHEAIKVELAAGSRVRVLEAATVSRADPLLRRALMTFGAALAGLVFALFGVAWLEYRTRRVDTVDEVVLGLGMRLVGTVPAAKAKTRKASAKTADPAQQVLTESVDAARTMLLHLARTHSLRTVMITSAVAGEGKTSLSCHLAASLARAGLRMLLIDGDMRNPTAHRLFGMPCDAGLCEVLTDKIEVEKAVKETSLRGLHLMPAGHWTDKTALALSQGKPAALFEQLRQQFDLIIVDSSPILPVADGLMIGQQVDGVLLSVLCQVSRLTNLYAAWQRIAQLGVTPLGVVINGVSANLYGSSYSYPYPRKKRSVTKPMVEKGQR